MSVSFTPGFFFTPQDNASFPGDDGGLRIEIDEEVLTDHVNQDALAGFETVYDASGEPIDTRPAEFTGEWLGATLTALHDALTTFLTGDFERYEEVPAEVTAPSDPSVLVLSFVDGRRARLAFQPKRPSEDASNYRDASLLGYIVDPSDLCRELIGCYREWMAYVDNSHADDPTFAESELPEFHEHREQDIAELEQLID